MRATLSICLVLTSVVLGVGCGGGDGSSTKADNTARDGVLSEAEFREVVDWTSTSEDVPASISPTFTQEMLQDLGKLTCVFIEAGAGFYDARIETAKKLQEVTAFAAEPVGYATAGWGAAMRMCADKVGR